MVVNSASEAGVVVIRPETKEICKRSEEDKAVQQVVAVQRPADGSCQRYVPYESNDGRSAQAERSFQRREQARHVRSL